MGVTGRQIAATTRQARKCNGGYIWGQSGATWTADKQAALEKKYNSNPEKYKDYKYSVKYGKKWIGHRVWDCSGLTKWAAGQHGISYHHGSNSMWNYDMKYKGVLTKGMELPEGAYVYTGNDDKKPHIGTYNGDGTVTEAAGSNAGVIDTKLHGGKWKYWGLGKGIEYDFIPNQEEGEKEMQTLKKGSKGEAVKELQEKLLARGYKLQKYGADGDYGSETVAAVKAFQKDWGLKVDGIAGPETLKMLDSTQPKPAEKTYTVMITCQTWDKAKEIQSKYGGTVIEE